MKNIVTDSLNSSIYSSSNKSSHHKSLGSSGNEDSKGMTEKPVDRCIKLDKFIQSLQDLLEKDSSLSNTIMNSGGLGVRVVRGPDWKWAEQDDGLGHAGTVVEIGRSGSTTSPDQTVVVQWDSGVRTNYRMGFQKAYDLRILDYAPAGVRHSKHSCQICKSKIFGIRWSCSLCQETDLCNNCYNADRHDVSHPFSRIDTPNSTPVTLLPRKDEIKVSLKGIYPGAIVRRGPDWDWGLQDGGEGKVGVILDISGWDEESGRSVVSVKWNATESVNVYRLGHKGKVDVKYVPGREASLGTYYPEHLPILGKSPTIHVVKSSSSESSGIKFSIGDKVKICVDSENLRFLQHGHGGFSPKMKEIIGQLGVVHRFTDKGDVRVQYPGRPVESHRWTLNPKALVKMKTFEAGSIVRIINDCDKVRRLQDGHGNWIENMKTVLGKNGQVVKVYADGDVRVAIMGTTWTFNPACLILMPNCGSEGDRKPREIKEREDDYLCNNDGLGNQEAVIALASQGQLELLKEELKNVTGIKSIRYALQTAADRGHLDVVKYFVNQYPDEVDLKIGGKTPLHIAALRGRQKIIECLLASGANVTTVDDGGDCALHYAVLGSQPGVLDFLLSISGPSAVNAVNKKHCTALQVAVIVQNIECVEVLLKHNVDVNIQDTYKDTALHEAIIKDNHDIISLLCEHPKMDFRLQNHRGFNCLQYAALKGNVTALNGILVKARQLVEVKKSDGFSPLHLACLNGHYLVAKILLDVGRCQPDVQDNRGQTPLHSAAGQGHIFTVELLANSMKDKKQLSSIDVDGDTPMHLALKRENNAEQSSSLTDSKLAPDISRIILRIAKVGVKPEILRKVGIALFLAQRGASTSQKNLSGLTPLDLINDPIAISLFSLFKDSDSPCSSPGGSPRSTSPNKGTKAECGVCSEMTGHLVTFHPCGHRVVCRECWTPRIKKCLSCKVLVSYKTGSLPVKQSPRVLDLEAKVRDFEDQYLCTICMERKKNVAFQCGHSACHVCVETLRSCHMCRGSVEKRINLY